MPYTPDPTNVSQPADTGVPPSTAAAEFRALKVYLASIVAGTAQGVSRGAAGGTVDAITSAVVPALTVLSDRILIAVTAAGANLTTTPTVSPSGLTAKTIVKNSNQALSLGDIPGAGFVMLLSYDAGLDKWTLLNPASSSAPSGSLTASGYTQNSARLIGRTTGGAGAVEEITVGTGLALASGTLSCTISAGLSSNVGVNGLGMMVYGDTPGAVVPSGDSIAGSWVRVGGNAGWTGTWRNISPYTISTGSYGILQKIG